MGKFIVSDQYPSNESGESIQVYHKDARIFLTTNEAWELGNLLLKIACRRKQEEEKLSTSGAACEFYSFEEYR